MCFWHVESVLVCERVFLPSGLPLPPSNLIKKRKKLEGWRDGGAVSVKEEEEKIKWQGGYEMCV